MKVVERVKMLFNEERECLGSIHNLVNLCCRSYSILPLCGGSYNNQPATFVGTPTKLKRGMEL